MTPAPPTPGDRIQVNAWTGVHPTGTIYSINRNRFYPYVIRLDGEEWDKNPPTLTLKEIEFTIL